MNKKLVSDILIGLIIIVIMLLAFWVVQPILISIIFGVLFAFVLNPVYKRINGTIKNKTLSAFVLMLITIVLVLGPLLYFIPSFIQQVFGIFEDVRVINMANIITTLFPSIDTNSITYSLLLNLNNLPGKMLSALLDSLFNVFLNLPGILLQTFVFLFSFFYATRDSDKLYGYLSTLSPFSKTTEKKFLKEFKGITNSVILGQVLIGVVQGLFLGLGLLLLGVPNVLTWTIMTMIVSIIPVIGPWLVWVPVSGFLFLQGDTTTGIILALYGGIFVSNIDNFLRPYLLSRSSQLPVVVSLAGTIGGLYFLGIIGLILGPLILAYALIIIDFYREGRIYELYGKHKQGLKSYEIKG